jgi:hypothetical protein
VRWLFRIAEDSEENLDGYIDDGDVLVAVLEERPVGVLQMTQTGMNEDWEILRPHAATRDAPVNPTRLAEPGKPHPAHRGLGRYPRRRQREAR